MISKACELCGRDYRSAPASNRRFCGRSCSARGKTPRKLPSLAERFWRNVRPTQEEGCWVWLGSRFRQGYGQIRDGRLNKKAHRVSWELANGAIPAGMVIMHTCDNPPCVNIHHLRLGTHADNIADKYAKGREGDQRGEFGPRAKLTAAQVAEMRRVRAETGLPFKALGRMFGVHGSTAHAAVSGKTWEQDAIHQEHQP